MDGAIESLESLPTATATHELDVSIERQLVISIVHHRNGIIFICRTVHIHYSTPLDSHSVCVLLLLLLLLLLVKHHHRGS